MAISLLIGFICVVCYKVSLAGDPCENFKVFPNEILRNTSYESGSSGRISDQYITEDWYGSLKEFPTDPPGVNKCGTSFPVWAKEEVIADDGSINVTMCTQIPGNECIESFIIHGKKCDNFKIYYLKRTGTDSAYCLDATKEAAPEQVMKPVVNPDLIQLTNNDALIFRCTFDKSTADVFYKIYWYVENKTLPSSQPHKWIDREKNNVLNETTIKDHGWDRVGFHVYCSVRSSYEEQSAESLPIFSDARYVGIKLYNTTVHLHSEAIKIFFKLTAPFGCLGGTECSLHIQLLETESNPDKTCTRQNLVASDCGIKVKKGDWDNIQSITIKGRNNVDKYKDKTLETVMKLTTSPSNWNHGIWANYTDFGYVVIVTTTNTSKIEGKMCRAVCDPHMTTLDGKWYEHQYEGIFTLYANVKLEAEVQVETAPCGLAFCICGLVVRAGRTVFAIEQCHRQRNIDFLFCDDEDDVLDVRRRSSTQYEILFPSGTIVKANLLNYGSYFMDIYVVPSVHDVDNSRGLCGKLSDTDTDDFVKRNGSVSEFSESWRVTENNLFDNSTYNDLKAWDLSRSYCSCPACENPPCGKVKCGPTQEVKSCQTNGPPDGNKVTPNKRRCSIHARRKKRSVVGPDPNSRQMMSIHKRDTQDWFNGWTKEKATEFCENHFAASRSAQMCRDIPTVNIAKNIEDCVFDIWASGGTEFFDAALDNMQTGCMQEVVMNSSFHEETGGESVIDKVFKVACPNGCRRKGECVNGVCRCHTNYTGSDCSIDSNSPPLLTEVDFEGLCDVNDDLCTAVSVFGGTFVDSSNTTCKFRDIDENGNIVNSFAERVLAAQFESLFEVACPIPVHRSKRSVLGATAEEKARAYYVSVSNNGVAYSEEKIIIIYNSTCQTCTLSGTSVSCVISEDYCTLGTMCIPKGSSYPYEACLVCDINGKTKTWQDDPTCRSCMNTSLMWVLLMFPAFIMQCIF